MDEYTFYLIIKKEKTNTNYDVCSFAFRSIDKAIAKRTQLEQENPFFDFKIICLGL